LSRFKLIDDLSRYRDFFKYNSQKALCWIRQPFFYIKFQKFAKKTLVIFQLKFILPFMPFHLQPSLQLFLHLCFGHIYYFNVEIIILNKNLSNNKNCKKMKKIKSMLFLYIIQANSQYIKGC
jgi:hypothetical protein